LPANLKRCVRQIVGLAHMRQICVWSYVAHTRCINDARTTSPLFMPAEEALLDWVAVRVNVMIQKQVACLLELWSHGDQNCIGSVLVP
jgi:hypothetical protein